jgi:phosphonate transport system substrate-binding protein
MKKSLVLAILATLVFSLAALADAPKVVIGFNAKSPEAAEKDFGGLFKHLRSATNVQFDIQLFPSYDALYDAFKAKKIDAALLGAVKYAQAHDETGAVPVISEGGPVRGMIVVAKDSPIKTTSELKGKRFGFGYKDSTSTHLMPLLLLSKNQIHEADLKGEFLGTDQDKLVAKLLAGETDAIGIVETVYQRFPGKLRILEQSDPFPGSPLIVQKSMARPTMDAVQKTFLAYKPNGGTRFLAGVTPVDDSKFNQVRFLCRVLYGKTYH